MGIYFPSQWRRAFRRPIPKNSSPSGPDDYRPVSLLCAISKIFEKIVFKQVNEFLNLNNLNDLYQSGFRRGHSTQTALLKVTQDLLRGIDGRRLSILLLFDFSKAFDTVNLDLLLSKLARLNFSRSAIGWFQSYLTGREQAVIGSSGIGSFLKTNRGVPQGSVLGPLLFSIYISDISRVIDCNYHLYADDLQIYRSFIPSEGSAAVDTMNATVGKICSWAGENDLVINARKTKAILIGSRSLTARTLRDLPGVQVEGVTLPYETCVKNLGILMDSGLTWLEQVEMVHRRVYSILYQIGRLREFLPLQTRAQLVRALIMPHFDYGSVVYGGLSAGLGRRLDMALNACVRFVFGASRFEHVSQYYDRLGWLRLAERRAYLLGGLLYKIINSGIPAYLFNILKFSNKKMYGLRSSQHNLMIPNHTSTAFHESFLVRSAHLWNLIPLSWRGASYETFLANLRAYVVSVGN